MDPVFLASTLVLLVNDSLTIAALSLHKASVKNLIPTVFILGWLKSFILTERGLSETLAEYKVAILYLQWSNLTYVQTKTK